LFELVAIKRKDDTKPPRAFADYAVTIDKPGVLAGVELIEMV